MAKASRIDTQCKAFQAAIGVLGRPWTGLILSLLQAGPQRFTDLRDSSRGLSDKVLAERLRLLEQKKLVTRRVEKGPPVRVLYQLEPRGRAFHQVAEAIERWGRSLV
jgi:DNA-binding HxlR family transcriptional regulator